MSQEKLTLKEINKRLKNLSAEISEVDCDDYDELYDRIKTAYSYIKQGCEPWITEGHCLLDEMYGKEFKNTTFGPANFLVVYEEIDSLLWKKGLLKQEKELKKEQPWL